MTGLKNRWRKFRSSLAFRLSMYYSVSAFVIIVILLGVIYLQVMGAVHGNVFKKISADAKRLEAVYEQRGREGVIVFLEQELSSLTLLSPELIYMLGENGEKILGNIDDIPLGYLTGDYLAEVGVYKAGRYINVRLRKIRLGNEIVFLGRDLQELARFRALIGRIGFVTVIIALLLTALSTYWFLFELRLGANSIRKTAMQIRAGRFRKRIPYGEQEDELNLLIKELNLMLDHMESSLHGVRYVSDTIAHNLRTPVMRVHSILRPLMQQDKPADAMRLEVGRALEELELLTGLFDKLLYVSELESGVQRQGFKKINMSALVEEMVDLYSAYAEERQLMLSFKRSEPIFVYGDSDLIASALSNLIENALKYTTNQVQLSISHDSTWVRVIVADNGLGVYEESLVRLGQHFYRDAKSESIPGTGLGLASVLAIMSLHQGNCTFENTNDGFKACLNFPFLD